MNDDFIVRLLKTFDDASMAQVAKRLRIPHATVRNYYQGRLPAPEVLIKIANETGVSLNWLLTGTGDMYGGQRPPIGLGKFIEERIAEIVDQRIAASGKDDIKELKSVDFRNAFDVESAVLSFDDPQLVMGEWFRHEGRDYPQDYGIVFFRGWETFSPADKVDAVRDAKKVLDLALRDKML